MPVIECNTDEEFQEQMNAAGSKPVIVDFTASWCGPCKMIAPVFAELSEKYADTMIFLKVDVDKCEDTSASNGVSAMPTFMIFINGEMVHQFRGANANALAEACDKYGHI